jgi:serine/threonine protein kinase
VTLSEWLAQHPSPPTEDAVRWIAGVLRGLAFGHDAGVAHLDAELHNIVINERGQASVMAFAVAVADIGDGDAAPTGRATAAPRRSPRQRCVSNAASRPCHRRRCARCGQRPSAMSSPAA